MRLPNVPSKYDPSVEIERNRQLEREDDLSYKKNQDVDIAQGRLILRSPNGSRWAISVTNAGVITATAA